MKFAYPHPTLPRATAVTDMLLADAETPERIDPTLRRVLAARIVALAPHRHAGSIRLDSYAVLQARRESPEAATPFSWSPRIARRILGVAATQRVVAGITSTPTAAVRAEIESAIARSADSQIRPGSLGAWLSEAPFGVLGAVIGEATTYATELLTALEWERLAGGSVGAADPVWAVPGAPWVSLRGRRDVTVPLNDDAGTYALVVVRSGRMTSSSHEDLAHVALVEGLTHPDRPLPTRVVGLWPASGKAVSLEVTKETTQSAARIVVSAMEHLRKNVGARSAA